MKNFSTLTLNSENGIAVLVFNRPEKLNALNQLVMEELEQALEICWNDASIRGVILTGAGVKAFVAGADITEFKSLNSEDASMMATKGQALFTRIEKSTKPIIAAVNGYALGGGCELAMSCHFRIAAEQAIFGQPEVSLGLIPGYGGTQRLPQLVGKGKAMEMILTGVSIDATEALRIGLVNHVVASEILIDTTKKILQTILSKAPLAVAASIDAIQSYYELPGTGGYRTEAHLFGACFGTDDTQEGVQAFIEKRKPTFTGK